MYHWHKTFFCWGLIYWIPLVAEIKHWQAVNAHSLKFKVSHEHHFNFNTFLMLPLTIWVLMSLSLIGLHSFIMSGLLQLPVFWPPCWYTSHPPNPKPLISRCMTVMSPLCCWFILIPHSLHNALLASKPLNMLVSPFETLTLHGFKPLLEI